MINKNFLSKFTVSLGAYIIVSASFMRQVWEFLDKMIGAQSLRTICIFINLLLGIALLLYINKSHLSALRFRVAIIIVGFAFYFAWRQPYFVEKLHVLEYGLLGWLAVRDLRRHSGINIVKPILFSLLFVLVIGGLDEGFQKLLPYRVGEIRDVITNLISGLCGIALYLIK
jgi:hypothetical protein